MPRGSSYLLMWWDCGQAICSVETFQCCCNTTQNLGVCYLAQITSKMKSLQPSPPWWIPLAAFMLSEVALAQPKQISAVGTISSYFGFLLYILKASQKEQHWSTDGITESTHWHKYCTVASVLNIGHTTVKSRGWCDICLTLKEIHNISTEVEEYVILLVCKGKALPFKC